MFLRGKKKSSESTEKGCSNNVTVCLLIAFDLEKLSETTMLL